MAKTTIGYVCSNCGQESPKWIGKCPSCGSWNTFQEVTLTSSKTSSPHTERFTSTKSTPKPIDEITVSHQHRIDMGDDELNRVLGGGLVPGSVVLIGGEPGIGKSTLTLQTLINLKNKKILYISGEESYEQIKMRADRMINGQTTNHRHLLVLCETLLENILTHISSIKPDIIVIDSIQTIASSRVDSSPGSVTQIRESTSSLLRYAKSTATPVILIGHITKDGTLAGPKILEHMIDTVIYFEGDQQHLYRVLRAVKNRFGSTSELGIYEMMHQGLRPVENPSELLLANAHNDLSGVAISPAAEGARIFFVETQALVSNAAYGTPQRSANGIDQRRLNMLLSVLEKRVGFRLIQKDVFVNIAGGLRITDSSIDLSVMASVMSSSLDCSIPRTWCLAGEVGLSGEVRPVARLDQRIVEARRLGFTDIVVPCQNSILTTDKTLEPDNNKRINVHPVSRVEEALRLLWG